MMSYLIINKKNMFAKFEFIAGLVEKGEVVFNYEERKSRIKKTDDLEEFNYGSKPNPLLEKKVYKTRAGFAPKTYGVRTNETYSAEARTPAYKRGKFSGARTGSGTNKKGNSGMGYKAARKK